MHHGMVGLGIALNQTMEWRGRPWRGGGGGIHRAANARARAKGTMAYMMMTMTKSSPLTVTPSGHGKIVTVTRLSL